ncbi:hypothetical protein TNCV_4150781 [Trichonephila clavipes]|nr:hypothetical protein TNCV_4150781 [Trichonephila clavipes]
MLIFFPLVSLKRCVHRQSISSRPFSIKLRPSVKSTTVIQSFDRTGLKTFLQCLALTFLRAHPLPAPDCGNPAVLERHDYPLLNLYPWQDRQLHQLRCQIRHFPLLKQKTNRLDQGY